MHAVVVGSGIAGLTAALHAIENGCRVTLVTKDVLEHANTRYAQGGIAGVTFDDDCVEDHIRDTIVAGCGLNDSDAVCVLAQEGPARIRDLVAAGVAFDRGADGAFVKGLEAAHSYPRILHSGGDATGTEIEKALVAQLRASDVTVIEHAFLVDLVTDPAMGRVCGIHLLVDDSRSEMVAADAVVLATGGAGQLYAHTTNPAVAAGDGIAAAIRAGAAVADLEFVQFHPTVLPGALAAVDGTLSTPDMHSRRTPGALSANRVSTAVGREPFLVSEAVRGEGATLIDERGRRFAFDAHPDGELAPRDVVARAIARTMEQQDGRPVYLDATALGAGFLARRFPTIDRAVRERGLDWAREPVPVTPAAHYLMGGVATDLHGRTTLPGLYAVGEVARTGVHGANRLASNSLLEGAVFGARAGNAIASDAASGAWPRPKNGFVEVHGSRYAAAPPLDQRDDGSRYAAAPPVDQPFTRAALQEVMWEHAGLVRDATGLRHAASVIAQWRAEHRAPRTEAEFEDDNLLLVAAVLVTAALARTASIGAHFRRDDETMDASTLAPEALTVGVA